MVVTTSHSTVDTVRLELLKAVFADARDLLPNYVRGYTFYIVVTGALLKFAFDLNATPKLRQMLAWLGIVISVVGLLVCVYGEVQFRRLRRDATTLARSLSVEIVPSFAMPLHYLAIISLAMVIVVIVGWLYVLSAF